jgi:hypothetical protein
MNHLRWQSTVYCCSGMSSSLRILHISWWYQWGRDCEFGYSEMYRSYLIWNANRWKFWAKQMMTFKEEVIFLDKSKINLRRWKLTLREISTNGNVRTVKSSETFSIWPRGRGVAFVLAHVVFRQNDGQIPRENETYPYVASFHREVRCWTLVWESRNENTSPKFSRIVWLCRVYRSYRCTSHVNWFS